MLCERCQTLLKPSLPEINKDVFDRERRSVIVNGRYRRVSFHAWSLLELFWRHRTRMLSHDELYDWLYAEELDPPSANIVAVYICRLRKALGGSPYRIALVWGEGYRFESVESQDSLRVIHLARPAFERAIG